MISGILRIKWSTFVIIFLALFLFFAFTDDVSAATWYISTSGTDDVSHGTGTGTDAWATLDYALTGSRVESGDTINVEAGTYDSFNGSNTYINTLVNYTSSDDILIQAYPSDAEVTFNMPSNTNVNYSFLFVRNTRYASLKFKNINFTNSNSVDASLFFFYGHTVTLEDCSIDMNDAGKTVIYVNSDSSLFRPTILNLTRTIIKNSNSSSGSNTMYLNNGSNSSSVITIESSVFNNTGNNMDIRLQSPATLNIYNNTFVDGMVNIYDNCIGSTLNVVNNIFYNPVEDSTVRHVGLGSQAILDDFISNSERLNVTSNIWYNDGEPAPFFLVTDGTELIPDDSSNHFIDPLFTDFNGEDYSLQVTSPICGLGDVSALPAEGDFNEASWTGSDIGAFQCPTTGASLDLLDLVSFTGDSIMRAGSIDAPCYDYFTEQTGIDHVSANLAAISGTQMEVTNGLVDRIMVTQKPDTVFLSTGINNLMNVSPSEATNQQYADYLLEIMEKIEGWGATPIWIGLGSFDDYLGFDDTRQHAINDLVEAGCVANGWSCGAYLDNMELDDDWQDTYYPGDTNLHPEDAGHEVIGETAEYLYYHPTDLVGTDEIDIGGGAKIYGTGYFRTPSAASGTTASLAITPSSGSFVANDHSPWMEISDITWDTSTTYEKQWTETSSFPNLTDTIHTVGDMETASYYSVVYNHDGGGEEVLGVYKSNGSGEINFTYPETYSEVIFSVSETTAPSLSIADVSVDEDAGTASISVTLTGSLASDSITVDYATSSGIATSGSDFTATSDTLTWAAGETGAKTFSVSVTDETIVEPDETVILTLSNVANATISDGDGILTITNDDRASSLFIPNNSSLSATNVPIVTLDFIGEQIGGQVKALTWKIDGFGIDVVNLYYSVDGGTKYTNIISNLDCTFGTYDWTVPDINSDIVLIKIIGYSGSTQLDSDISSFFTIKSADGDEEIIEESEEDDESITEVDNSGNIVAVNSGEVGISPITGEIEDISIVTPGQYIKSYGFSTIYYIDENMNRRPFWNENIFFTYADSFEQVVWVTDATLSTLTLGAPMLPNPSSILVKIQSNPRVYSISGNNILNWIPDEVIAIQLYGDNWSDCVIDLEPTIFTRFEIGDDLTTDSVIDAGIMKSRAKLAKLAQDF